MLKKKTFGVKQTKIVESSRMSNLAASQPGSHVSQSRINKIECRKGS